MTGIYMITNVVNEKHYVGQAKNIEYRWMRHRSALKCGTHHNRHLQSAYNAYGSENFEYTILEECQECDLDEREQYYIKLYDSYNNGYNLDIGGGGCKGYKHTDEEIYKMRMIQNPKMVLQIDKQRNVVREWMSCSHAGKTLGLSIRGIKAVCDRVNHQKTMGGYIWVYKEEYENSTVDWDYYMNNNKVEPKQVGQYDMDDKLIKIYPSMYSVQKDGHSLSCVAKCCNEQQKYHHGYKWHFIKQD